MDNSIPGVQEREGKGKNPFPKFGNRKGIKNTPKIWEWEEVMEKSIPKIGNRKGMKKNIPEIREQEGNEKNPFP